MLCFHSFKRSSRSLAIANDLRDSRVFKAFLRQSQEASVVED